MDLYVVKSVRRPIKSLTSARTLSNQKMYDMWEGDLIQETTSMLCIKILESILEVPHWTRKMFYLQCTLFIIGNQTFSNGIK